MDQGDAAAPEGETDAAVMLAVPVIVSSLGVYGVTNVQWFLAYHGYPVIWLVTTTDLEKAAIVEQGFLRPEVLSALSGGWSGP
jgi:hypothetical protein